MSNQSKPKVDGVPISKETAAIVSRLIPNASIKTDSEGNPYVPDRPAHPEASATRDFSLNKDKGSSSGSGSSTETE